MKYYNFPILSHNFLLEKNEKDRGRKDQESRPQIMGKYLFFLIIDMWIMEICFRLTLKRRSPVGGLAYGMPLNMFTGRSSPVTLYVCLLPSTGPLVVSTCTFIILFRFQLYTIISILCNMQWIFNYFLLGNYNLVLGTILTLF